MSVEFVAGSASYSSHGLHTVHSTHRARVSTVVSRVSATVVVLVLPRVVTLLRISTEEMLAPSEYVPAGHAVASTDPASQ